MYKYPPNLNNKLFPYFYYIAFIMRLCWSCGSLLCLILVHISKRNKYYWRLWANFCSIFPKAVKGCQCKTGYKLKKLDKNWIHIANKCQKIPKIGNFSFWTFNIVKSRTFTSWNCKWTSIADAVMSVYGLLHLNCNRCTKN